MKHIRKLMVFALVVASVLAIALPAMATTTGVYNTAAVHLRSTIGGTSLGLVSKNATCNILRESTVGGTKWYKVKITSHTSNTPDLYNIEGWSQARYISTNGSSVPTGPQTLAEAFGSANLSIGSQGNYVRNVQLCLVEKGYNIVIDGDFGNATYTAVCQYQVSAGVLSDGIVGSTTKAAFWNDSACRTRLMNSGY